MARKNRPNPKRRQRLKAIRNKREDLADPLDGDGLSPIIEASKDVKLLDELLAMPDWEIPDAATKRVPTELTRIALGVDKQGKPDPSITSQAQMRASQVLDKLQRTNMAKRAQAIKAIQRRQAIDKGVIANNVSNVQVVVYMPEKAELSEYEVVDSETRNIEKQDD